MLLTRETLELHPHVEDFVMVDGVTGQIDEVHTVPQKKLKIHPLKFESLQFSRIIENKTNNNNGDNYCSENNNNTIARSFRRHGGFRSGMLLHNFHTFRIKIKREKENQSKVGEMKKTENIILKIL